MGVRHCLGLLFLELFILKHKVNGRDKDEDDEAEHDETGEHGVAFHFRLKWIGLMAHDFSAGVCYCSSVDANHDHIAVVVEGSVEITQEDVPEAISVRFSLGWVQSNLAITLVLINHVGVAPWHDLNCCVFKFELYWLQVGPNVRAGAVNVDLVIVLRVFLLLDLVPFLLLECLVLHGDQDAIPNELWQHNTRACRVNESNLGSLTICHVFTVVQEVVNL